MHAPVRLQGKVKHLWRGISKYHSLDDTYMLFICCQVLHLSWGWGGGGYQVWRSNVGHLNIKHAVISNDSTKCWEAWGGRRVEEDEPPVMLRTVRGSSQEDSEGSEGTLSWYSLTLDFSPYLRLVAHHLTQSHETENKLQTVLTYSATVKTTFLPHWCRSSKNQLFW